MSKKFNKLKLSPHWQQYFSKYPDGYTIIENLIDWVSQVDNMVDNQNELNDTVNTYGDRLDEFIGQYDTHLQETVEQTLSDWQTSGFLNMIINETLDTKYHAMDDRLTSQLAQMPETTDRQLSATLGPELITNSGWVMGDGWSGNLDNGFTHTPGKSESLYLPITPLRGRIYQVEFDTNKTIYQNQLDVYFGNSLVSDLYRGDIRHYAVAVQPRADSGGLFFKPKADLDVTITNITLKQAVSQIPLNYDLTTTIKDENNQVALEYRATDAELDNLYLGKKTGRYNTSGHQNVAVGHQNLEWNASGFWNTAVGIESLKDNVSGSRNIGVGIYSLWKLISGHRNIGVGTYALARVSSGAHNIGVGADTAWYTTTGSGNIAIGTTALEFNEEGNENIAIGYRAMRNKKDTDYNIAIGSYALDQSVAGTSDIAVGYQALMNTTGSNNVAIGHQAGHSHIEGQGNVIVGSHAFTRSKKGTSNTIIGIRAGRDVEGNNNVIIGNDTANRLRNGTRNILIGSGVDIPDDNLPNRGGYMNIGNVLTSDLDEKLVTIGGGIAHSATLRLNKIDNHPQLVLDSGTLIPNARSGALEFDGTNLYFTIDGSRKIVQLA